MGERSSAGGIVSWLEKIGLEQYAQTFFDEVITLDDLPLLTETDIDRLELPTGPRRKLLVAVAQLKSQVLSHGFNGCFQFSLIRRISSIRSLTRDGFSLMVFDEVVMINAIGFHPDHFTIFPKDRFHHLYRHLLNLSDDFDPQIAECLEGLISDHRNFLYRQGS